MKSHEIHDVTEGGTKLIVCDGPYGGAAGIRAVSRDGLTRILVNVDSVAVLRLLDVLHKSAGLPLPLTLPAPEPGALLVRGPHGEELVKVEPCPAGHPSSVPGVMLMIGNRGVRMAGDEPLRVAAAIAAAHREAAEAPDPAEVDELAQVMYLAVSSDSDRCAMVGEEVVAARAALRWMRDREAKS